MPFLFYYRNYRHHSVIKKYSEYKERKATSLKAKIVLNQIPQSDTTKRVFLYSSSKASLTIEAAICIPFFIVFWISILSILQILTFYTKLDISLASTARESAIYANKQKENLDNSMVTITSIPFIHKKTKQYLTSQKTPFFSIQEEKINYNFGLSNINSNVLDIIVEYEIKPVFQLLPFPKVVLQNRILVKNWTGYYLDSNENKKEEQQEYVFVTETGTVYHTNRQCTHLVLTISPIQQSVCIEQRNKYNEKYLPCEKCRPQILDQLVYITDEGNHYHNSLMCSGLKRTVITIKLEEKENRTRCIRCSGMKE